MGQENTRNTRHASHASASAEKDVRMPFDVQTYVVTVGPCRLRHTFLKVVIFILHALSAHAGGRRDTTTVRAQIVVVFED